MNRYLVPIFGLAAFLLIAWNVSNAFFQPRTGFPLPEAEKQVIQAEVKLPTDPADWHGKIDYTGLDRQFAMIAARPEMAGLAVAIIEDDELRFVGSYGVTDKDSGERVTPQTVFRWASVSKGVAGSLAAKLSDKGKLNLGSTLDHWQTSLILPENATSRLSLAQLLSHQTGLTKNAYDDKLEAGESPKLLRMQLRTAPLQCEPGTCHSYQNIAYDTASEILSQATGTSYEKAVESQLFAPLAMKSAQFGMRGLTSAKSWARPHHGDKVGTLSESYWRVPAAAGVSSNIVDLARWMKAQMGDDQKILSTADLNLAHNPRVKTHRVYSGELARALAEPGYGLGWRSFTYRGHRLIGHSGAVDGFRATIIFDPVAHTGVVAMWNNGWGLPFRIPFAALDSYYGISSTDQQTANWLDLSNLPAPKPAPPSRRQAG